MAPLESFESLKAAGMKVEKKRDSAEEQCHEISLRFRGSSLALGIVVTLLQRAPLLYSDIAGACKRKISQTSKFDRSCLFQHVQFKTHAPVMVPLQIATTRHSGDTFI